MKKKTSKQELVIVTTLWISFSLLIVSCGGSSSPEASYMSYLKARESVDIKTMKKYMSKNLLKEIELAKVSLRMYSKRVNLLMPKDVKVVSVTVSGNKVTLSVEGIKTYPFDKTKKKAQAIIKMVLEDNMWKVLNEKW